MKNKLDKIVIKALPDEYGDETGIGIRAEATILIPIGGGSSIIQHITSGGIWGLAGDEKESYLEEVGMQELEDLIDILKKLNVDVTNFMSKTQKSITYA